MYRYLFLAIIAACLPVRGQAQSVPSSPRSIAAVSEVSAGLLDDLNQQPLRKGAPVFIQIIKADDVLRLYLQNDNGTYDLFRSYDICAWSGRLGPKLREGDGQSPEGFYRITPNQMNPNSSFHLSFNLGYPNQFDRAHGRTGSFLMVHGNCVSIGCYAMTDASISEIWTLMVWAFEDGQDSIPVHIFPFDLTASNLDAYADHEWIDFWTMLQPAWTAFEQKKIPPSIYTAGRDYHVN